MTAELEHYQSRGARALIILHEQHLRQCFETWREAEIAQIRLPATNDERYRSRDDLLYHILHSARSYIIRICQTLQLPAIEIEPVPDTENLSAEVDFYLEHLLAQWRLPLSDVTDDQMEPAEELYFAGMPYWVDAMLEHAVMHPIRHEFQLQELLERQATP